MDWLKRKTGLFLLLFGVLIIIAVAFNHELFILINSHATPWLDRVMFFVTQLGDGFTGTLLCLWLAMRFPRAGSAGILALIVGTILVQPLKSLFDMPRPALVFDNVHIVGEILHHRSFPSGHSTTVMTVATVFLMISKPRLRWIVLSAAFLTGISRIYIGAHFPIDVTVGFALGWTAVMISLIILELTGFFNLELEARIAQTIIAFLLLIGSISCFFWYRVDGDVVFYRAIGLVFAVTALYRILTLFQQRRNNHI